MEIYTVELYRKVRLACADGMSKRAAAAHFNISRDTVEKALTGYHRKHAIRLFSASPSSARMPMERHSRPRTYGTDVAAALVLLWNLSDRLCSKRLREMMPLLLPAAVQHGVLEDRPALHALLRAISA